MTPVTPPQPVLDTDLLEAMLLHLVPEHAPDPVAHKRMRAALLAHLPPAAPAEPGPKLFVHQHQGQWFSVLPGVELKLLRQDGRHLAYLVRLAPGASIPAHEHPLDEENLVLEGEVTIDGVPCYAGDYHFAPRGTPHLSVTSTQGGLMFVRGACEPSQLR